LKNLIFCMLLVLFSFPAIVDANEPVVGIAMNKPSTSIQVGGTDQLQAIFAPDVIWHFTWSSSNPAVATVIAERPEMGNAYGLVTGISPGTATITATRINGVGYATCVVTVSDVPATMPTITRHPMHSVTVANGPAIFNVIATGTEPLTYQWQRSNDGGNTWSSIIGANTANYSFTAQFIDDGAYFRVVVSNNDGSITSNIAQLDVNGPAISFSIKHEPCWSLHRRPIYCVHYATLTQYVVV